jgi:glycosyltransferase 2 family protein
MGAADEARRPTRKKRILKAVVSGSLLVGVLVLIARRQGFDALVERARGLHGLPLLAAVGLQLGSVGFAITRWRILLRAQGIDLPLRRLARSFFVGRFYGVFTPSTAGLDVYRAVDIGRAAGDGVRSAAAIVVEKLCGLLSLALVTFALLPFGGDRWLGREGIVLTAAVGLCAIAGLVSLRRPALFAPLVARLPRRVRPKLEGALQTVTDRPLGGLSLFRALALGALSHLCMSAVYAATAHALGLEIGLAELLLVGNAIIVATLLPVSVAGVGVREGTAVALLGAIGVSPADALLVAVLGFLATQPPALVGGAIELGGALGEGAPGGTPGI